MTGGERRYGGTSRLLLFCQEYSICLRTQSKCNIKIEGQMGQLVLKSKAFSQQQRFRFGTIIIDIVFNTHLRSTSVPNFVHRCPLSPQPSARPGPSLAPPYLETRSRRETNARKSNGKRLLSLWYSSTNSEHQRPQTGIKPLVCNIPYNEPQHIVHNNQKADDGNITAQSLALIIRPILQTHPLNPPTHAKRPNTVHNTITTKKNIKTTPFAVQSVMKPGLTWDGISIHSCSDDW